MSRPKITPPRPPNPSPAEKGNSKPISRTKFVLVAIFFAFASILILFAAIAFFLGLNFLRATDPKTEAGAKAVAEDFFKKKGLEVIQISPFAEKVINNKSYLVTEAEISLLGITGLVIHKSWTQSWTYSLSETEYEEFLNTGNPSPLIKLHISGLHDKVEDIGSATEGIKADIEHNRPNFRVAKAENVLADDIESYADEFAEVYSLIKPEKGPQGYTADLWPTKKFPDLAGMSPDLESIIETVGSFLNELSEAQSSKPDYNNDPDIKAAASRMSATMDALTAKMNHKYGSSPDNNQ